MGIAYYTYLFLAHLVRLCFAVAAKLAHGYVLASPSLVFTVHGFDMIFACQTVPIAMSITYCTYPFLAQLVRLCFAVAAKLAHVYVV